MTDHDDDLRAELHQAVAGIQPRRGVESVRARLEDTGRPRGWLTAAAAAVIAVIVVTGGVAWLHHETNTSHPAPSGQGHQVDVIAYYLGSTAVGDRLFSEHHSLDGVTTSDVQAAVDQALGVPDDPDYHSGFPAGTTATLTTTPTGDILVDFTQPGLATAPKRTPEKVDEAVQALVWTINATMQRPVTVHFSVAGHRVTTLLGQPVAQSVEAGPADSVLSPVSVDVAEGAQLVQGSTITGQAAAFEGNVAWELRQGTQVVKRGYTTAGQCCMLSPYAFQLDAPPGSYTLIVQDTNASGIEGHGVTSDSKDIVITP